MRSGLANRLFAYGTRVIALDPECEQGGGLRLLSGLHGRLPKIPFVSGFVRRDQALAMLERLAAEKPDGVERVERSDLRRWGSEALAAQMSAEAP